VIEGETAQRLWQEAVALLQQEISASAADAQVFDALATLANYSMVTWYTERQTATVHRVVQEILRNRLPKVWYKAWLTLSLRLLDAARPDGPTDVRTWPRWNRLRPHVAAAARQGDEDGILEPTAGLMSNLALLLFAKALHVEAEPLMRRALTIDEQSFTPDHPNVATRLNNLARLLQDTNRMAEAEPLMRRALVILSRSLGLHHPNTETVAANYRYLLNEMGQPADPILARLIDVG
jgi:tetratricopeptide (TPR) repeat protein